MPADRWDAFGALVAEAANATWPGDQVARDSVAALVQDLKARATRSAHCCYDSCDCD